MTVRRARAEEAPLLRALVERAYAPWVPVVGRRPVPMDDDYEARVSAGEAWVLEDAGAVRGVLVLEEHADHLLLENVAVEPARRPDGSKGPASAACSWRSGWRRAEAPYGPGFRGFERAQDDGRGGVSLVGSLGDPDRVVAIRTAS